MVRVKCCSSDHQRAVPNTNPSPAVNSKDKCDIKDESTTLQTAFHDAGTKGKCIKYTY